MALFEYDNALFFIWSEQSVFKLLKVSWKNEFVMCVVKSKQFLLPMKSTYDSQH